MGKQLVSFITCYCKSSAPFFAIYKAGRKPTPYWVIFRGINLLNLTLVTVQH